MYEHLIFDTARNIQWKNESIFMVKLEIYFEMKVNRPIFITLHRTQFNITPDIHNLIEDRVKKSLERIGTGDDFLIRIPIA